MNFLWLDDERPTPTPTGWDLVRDFDEFAYYVACHPEPPKLVSFDHDLAQEHYEDYLAKLAGHEAPVREKEIPTGYDCLRLAIDHVWLPETAVVHTMNAVARKRMVAALEDEGYFLTGVTPVLNAYPFSPVLRRS